MTEAKKLEAVANREKFQIGTLLCNSWGYDQTNIDYYEVVARSKTGAQVTLRRIASKTVSAGEFMSAKVAPCPGQFIGDPIKKRVTHYGIQFECGWTKITAADETHRASWYA